MDKQEQYKKMINNWLNGQLKGIYSFTQKNNPYVLTKKGVSKEFIANTIIDFILNNEEKVNKRSSSFLDIILNETDTLPILIKNPTTMEKVVKVMNTHKDWISYKTYIKCLYESNLNLNFFEGTEKVMKTTIGTTALSVLFEYIDKGDGGWDSDYVKKFMFYFLDDENKVAFYKGTLSSYFLSMSNVIEKYIASNTNLFSLIPDNIVIHLIESVGDETIIKEIIANKDYDDYDNEAKNIKNDTVANDLGLNRHAI
jgi:hypothetical protein